jgi:hypothetical protein
MEHAELFLDAPVVTGKAVEVVNERFLGERGGAALGGGEILEIVDAVKAEMVDGYAVNEVLFSLGERLVFLLDGFANLFVDGCFVRL